LKRIVFIMLSVLLAFSIASTASAAVSSPQAIKVTVNGKVVDLGAQLLVTKGKAFVEYAALFKTLGYETEWDQATRTIQAVKEGEVIQASVGGDIAFYNGQTVTSTGEVITAQGKVWVGIRFVGALTQHKVDWSSKDHQISLTYQGPTAEQKAALFDIFNKMLLVEAAGDGEGLTALITDNSPMDTKGVQERWKKTKTKTVIESKYIQSYSDSVAMVVLVEDTSKVSGGFFADNISQTLYTLHFQDGTWKIHNVEPLAIQYKDIPGLFNQTATIPEAEKAAITKVFEDQIKATNDQDIEAYVATLVDFEGKAALKQTLADVFKTTAMTVVTEQLAIVEYNGSDKATLLIEMISDVNTNGVEAKVRSIVLNDAEKVGDKWLLKAEAAVLGNEQI